MKTYSDHRHDANNTPNANVAYGQAQTGDRPNPSKSIGATPYIVWTPSQFIAYQDDQSAVLLGDGILALGTWTTFGGVGGLGKTRMTLQLLFAQMLGRPWCGLETFGEPQRALFFSTENGMKRYKSDFERMFLPLTEEEKLIVENHFFIPPSIEENDLDLCLGDHESVARLQATIAAVQPGIVVFDPWADMVDGDENKTEDVVATLRTLKRILRNSAPNAAVLIVTHSRTGSSNIVQAGDNFSAGNFMRGAKALFSKVRVEIQLAPGDKDDATRLVMACGKNNDGQKFSTRGVIFNPETFNYSVDPAFSIDEWRADVNGRRVDKSVTIADVVDVVARCARSPGEEVPMCEIMKEIEIIGGTKRSAQRRIKDAISQSYLRDGSKRGWYRLGSKILKAA